MASRKRVVGGAIFPRRTVLSIVAIWDFPFFTSIQCIWMMRLIQFSPEGFMDTVSLLREQLDVVLFGSPRDLSNAPLSPPDFSRKSKEAFIEVIRQCQPVEVEGIRTAHHLLRGFFPFFNGKSKKAFV